MSRLPEGFDTEYARVLTGYALVTAGDIAVAAGERLEAHIDDETVQRFIGGVLETLTPDANGPVRSEHSIDPMISGKMPPIQDTDLAQAIDLLGTDKDGGPVEVEIPDESMRHPIPAFLAGRREWFYSRNYFQAAVLPITLGYTTKLALGVLGIVESSDERAHDAVPLQPPAAVATIGSQDRFSAANYESPHQAAIARQVMQQMDKLMVERRAQIEDTARQTIPESKSEPTELDMSIQDALDRATAARESVRDLAVTDMSKPGTFSLLTSQSAISSGEAS